jgi:hypothetical protein
MKWEALGGQLVCFGVGVINREETAASKEILPGAILSGSCTPADLKHFGRREVPRFRKSDFEDLSFTERLRGLKQQPFSANV